MDQHLGPHPFNGQVESHPAMMVKCPTCAADPGHRCFFFSHTEHVGDMVHVARETEYKMWKEGLSSNGFIKR